jgi:hypothetical protein
MLWAYVHERIEARNDPPGWIMDRPLYPPATILADLGVLLLALSILISAVYLLWLGGKWISRRYSNHSH